MFTRISCITVMFGLASASLAAAPSEPAEAIVSRTIYVAFDAAADVAKVTEFTIDFGEPQSCTLNYEHWSRRTDSGMAALVSHEIEGDAVLLAWSGSEPYVAALGVTTDTVTGPSGSAMSGFGAFWDREFSGRHTVTFLVHAPAKPRFAGILPYPLALDLTCERPVTFVARAGNTLQFLPDQTPPVSASVPFAADAHLLGEWDIDIPEPSGHLMAHFGGSLGQQVGEVHLSTPDESVDVTLPSRGDRHLTAGAGRYRAEITHLTMSWPLWVAAYGAGPLDLTAALRDQPVIPPWDDLD